MSDTNAGADAHRPARGTTRRRLLQGTAALAGVTAASGAFTGFPTIWAQNIKDVVLHQAGSPVAAIPKIAEQANKCSAAIWMGRRIASPEMFPEAEMLPHLICSRPMFIGGAQDEADQRGSARRGG